MALSSKANLYSRSRLQEYGWRVFVAEFLCGLVAIPWYLLFLAERTALRGLTRLEKCAAFRPDNLASIGTACNVLFQDEGSYSELRNSDDGDCRNSKLRSF